MVFGAYIPSLHTLTAHNVRGITERLQAANETTVVSKDGLKVEIASPEPFWKASPSCHAYTTYFLQVCRMSQTAYNITSPKHMDNKGLCEWQSAENEGLLLLHQCQNMRS